MKWKQAMVYLMIQSVILMSIVGIVDNTSIKKAFLGEKINCYTERLYTPLRRHIFINDLDVDWSESYWEWYKEIGMEHRINPNTVKMLHGVYGREVNKVEWAEEKRRVHQKIKETLYWFRQNQIKSRMNDGLYASLREEAKNKLCLYEAIIQVTRKTDPNLQQQELLSDQSRGKLLLEVDLTDTFYKLFWDKQENEFFIERVLGAFESENKLRWKKKFENVLMESLTKDEILKIAKAMTFDDIWNTANQFSDLQVERGLPYKIGETTYDNFLKVSTSIVGKCRYAWGGGHGGAANISGINPVWKRVYQAYPKNDQISCIGQTKKTRFYPNISVDSLEHILTARGVRHFPYEVGEFTRGNGNYGYGLNSDNIDGLDCSGYVSWTMNQVDTSRVYDSVARNFATQFSSIQELDPNLLYRNKEKLRTGDVLSTYDHVTMVVGEAPFGSNVYIHIESTTPCVKFGVSYFEGAKQRNIEAAKRIAQEANSLFGDIGNSRVMVVNLNKQFMRKNTVTETLTENGYTVEEPTSLDYDLSDQIVEEEYAWEENFTNKEEQLTGNEEILETDEQILEDDVDEETAGESDEEQADEFDEAQAGESDAFTEYSQGTFESYLENSSGEVHHDVNINEPAKKLVQNKKNITVKQKEVYLRNLKIGRPNFFKDTYKEESAVTKLQRVIDNATPEYLIGLHTYRGQYFNIKKFKR